MPFQSPQQTLPDRRNNVRIVLLCAFVMLLTCVAPIRAEDSANTTQRPKVGLALGGGGARGLAHIGVLKVLEEMHVPIDYIAGTSSGAIIGGMYAAGLSPEEIETRIVGIDWDDILSDKLARRDLSYRRKQNDRTYLFPIEMGVKDYGLIFPRGLIAGQKVGFFLRSATLRAAGVTNFDRLPIPYRAVATDLENGNAVVLKSGDLAQAMLASMAIPGVFSPVEIDRRLLVDGGMSSNVPVEVVRAMGADIIIAVNISEPLLTRKQLESLVDISDQTLSFLSQKTNRQQLMQLRSDDILISPELGEFGSTDFERAHDVIEAGAAATQATSAELQRVSVSEIRYNAYLRRQRAPATPPEPLEFIDIKRPERVSRKIIERRLDTRAGKPLNIDTLRADLTRIYDLGDFERVDFRLIPTNLGQGLEIETKEKSWGPDYLRLGLNLIDDFEGDSRFNILANYTRTWVNPLGGEWKNEFSIGHTRKIFSEFYQPLDPFGVWFVAPHIQRVHDTRDVYSGNDRVAQYRTRVDEIGFDTGLELGKHGEFRVGLVRDWITAAPRIGATDLPEYEIQQGAVVGSLVLDRVDDVNFPRAGTLISARAFMARTELGADATYDKAELNWLSAFTYRTHTMFAGIDLGMHTRNDLPLYDTFTLGGFQHLSGYRTGQLNGQYLTFGRLVYYERVGRLPKATGNAVYIGASAEIGNVWESREDIQFGAMRKSAALFASANTVFGPLYLAFGVGNADNYTVYLFLGRTF